MTRATKGPWRYREDAMWIEDAKGNAVIYGGRDGDLVGRIEDITLATTSPELLEALKLLHAHLFGPEPSQSRSEIDDICRAAIAKAEGRA